MAIDKFNDIIYEDVIPNIAKAILTLVRECRLNTIPGAGQIDRTLTQETVKKETNRLKNYINRTIDDCVNCFLIKECPDCKKSVKQNNCITDKSLI